MKKLKPSTQYKKDLKKIRNSPQKAAALLKVLCMLENEIEIPKEYRSHTLTGDYKGCMECHIEGDFSLFGLTKLPMRLI